MHLNKCIFYLLLLIAPTSVMGQYLDFPDSNASWKWNEGHSEPGWWSSCSTIDTLYGDTLISGNQYKKIYSIRYVCYNQNPPFGNPVNQINDYQAAIRTDTVTGKVFAVLKDSSQESLIYDYGLQVGDTHHSVLQMFDQQISHVYYDTLGGISRKHLVLGGSQAIIIEGIGNTFGLLQLMQISLGGGTQLYCFAINGQSIYDSGSSIPGLACHQLVGMEEIQPGKQNLIFPNPTYSYIQISNDFTGTLFLLNLLGETIHKESVEANKEIDLEHLESGIYFYQLREAHTGRTSTGKLLKY